VIVIDLDIWISVDTVFNHQSVGGGVVDASAVNLVVDLAATEAAESADWCVPERAGQRDIERTGDRIQFRLICAAVYYTVPYCTVYH